MLAICRNRSNFTLFGIDNNTFRWDNNTLITSCYQKPRKEGFGPGEQEWGYVQVRPHAKMFWWMYYTTAGVKNPQQRPILIWLQGGPGASSTGYGNFEEIGPLDSRLNLRNSTWVKDYNVLFIDNPVGSGFSYVDSNAAFSTTNAQIAKDLLECMRGFYKALPSFRAVPIYILSESYGGKMAIEFANIWHQEQDAGLIKSNLKGVGLGDSWISPVDSVDTWAPYLLMTGMIDTEQHNRILAASVLTKNAVRLQDWTTATKLWSYTEQVILKETNNINFYNILAKAKARNAGISDDYDPDVAIANIMNGVVKDTLGLNSSWGGQSGAVFSKLRGDFMRPVTNEVEKMLNTTDLKVFVYTGQLDLIVDTPGTLMWVNKLRWHGAKNWRSAPRRPVVVDNVIEGYVKEYDSFKMYWINRAGHMVPADNPAGTAFLLKDLTSK